MRLEDIAASWVYDEPLQLSYSVVDVGMLYRLINLLVYDLWDDQFSYIMEAETIEVHKSWGVDGWDAKFVEVIRCY